DRHAYVLPTRARADHGSALVASGSMPKQMHVSPLLHMRSAYRWRVTAPGERLAVHIDYGEQEEPLFDATLSLRRREMTPAALRAVVTVRSRAFYGRLLRGSVGLGESYMDGLWDCEDLVSLTRIAARNTGALDRLRRALAPVLVPLQRTTQRIARNTPARARR